MKKLFILFALTATASFIHAQKITEKNVPAAVKSTLQKQFPNASNVQWEKEKDNYEAGFKLKETSYAVVFNASGNIVETETAISVAELAASIKDYVAKNYPGKKIKEAAKIIDAKGTITYEAEVNGKDLLFDTTGKFLKEVKD